VKARGDVVHQKVTVAVRAAYPEEGEYDWEEALLPFAALGSVEVAFHNTHLFLEKVDIRSVVAPFSALPLQASSLHMCHAKLTKPDVFVAALEKTVQIAEALSCPVIVVHPCYGSLKGRLQEVNTFLAQRIDPLLERAGVLLCWETFSSRRRFLSGIEGIAAFCEGRKWHAACYDTSHLLKPQEEVIADIKLYSQFIKCFHLSNRSEAEQHLPLRHPQGELDFGEILRAIVTSGFFGSITLEYLNKYHDHFLKDALWVKGMLEEVAQRGNAVSLVERS
jgi:sugar phosphate isomerase/epimerase